MAQTATTRYSTPMMALHWITVILVVAAYALMEFKGIFPKGSLERGLMKTIHFSVGGTILAVALLRLVLHFTSRIPAITPQPPRWQHRIGHLMHWILYAMLVVLPITGWLTLNGAGDTVHIWGLPLPDLMGPNKDLSRTLKDLHETIAAAGYWLVGLHALAALYHHYLVKDDTLRRMLPRGS